MQMLFWTIVAPVAFMTAFRVLSTPGVLVIEMVWPTGLPPIVQIGIYVHRAQPLGSRSLGGASAVFQASARDRNRDA
jgi:hypothetical protein